MYKSYYTRVNHFWKIAYFIIFIYLTHTIKKLTLK